jgi:hypothetical protein
MSAMSEMRYLLRPDATIVAGKYYDRPAPAHILNNFVLAALGRTAGADLVRELSRAPDAPARIGAHPAVVGAAWASDGEVTNRLRESVRIVFDPDRRVFPTSGSPLPIDWRLASPDASDDGIGRALWQSIDGDAQPAAAAGLAALLGTDSEADAPSVFARVLLRDVPDVLPDQPPLEPRRSGLLGELLYRLIGRLLVDADGPRRLEVIRELATLLHFATVLGLILEGVAHDGADVSQALGLVAFTGIPPGAPDDPLVRVAQRSFRVTVERAHAGLTRRVSESLISQMSGDVPADVRLKSSILTALRAGGSPNPDRNLRLLTDLVPISPEYEDDPAGWSAAAMASAYSVDDLQKALRAFGNKIGFTAPNRGFGQPRFCIEAPLLATITRAVVPEGSSVAFPEFITNVREQIGIVLGLSGLEARLDALPASTDVFGTARRAWEHLTALQELLRQRLIRAGIAREFSDGHTQVFRS